MSAGKGDKDSETKDAKGSFESKIQVPPKYEKVGMSELTFTVIKGDQMKDFDCN
jgi:hypothetical protein